MPWAARLRSLWGSFGFVEILNVQGFSLLARLSLLYLLFKPLGDKWERFPLLILAGWGLLAEGITRRAWFWLSALILIAVQMTWQSDNHVYLFCYWLLTLAIATLWSDPELVCEINGRLLIGCAMGLSVVWKAGLSEDYADGTFFHTMFFVDPRLKDFAVLAAGMTDELCNYNRYLLWNLDLGLLARPVFLKSTSSLWALALFSTWWTIAIEGLVAVLFLIPTHHRASKYREWSLLFFTASTYAVAPVAGFGWLLTILGLAQCPKERKLARLGLLASFVIILGYSTTSLTKSLAETLRPDVGVAKPWDGSTGLQAPAQAGPLSK